MRDSTASGRRASHYDTRASIKETIPNLAPCIILGVTGNISAPQSRVRSVSNLLDSNIMPKTHSDGYRIDQLLFQNRGPYSYPVRLDLALPSSELRRLPIAFKADQRSYRQVARKGCVALYAVFSNDPRQFHLILGYELLIITTKPAHRDEKGFYHPRSEVYPANRQFGKIAWSIPKASLPMAEILFEQIATSGSPHVYTTAVRQLMTGHRLPQDTRFVRTLRHKLGQRPKIMRWPCYATRVGLAASPMAQILSWQEMTPLAERSSYPLRNDSGQTKQFSPDPLLCLLGRSKREAFAASTASRFSSTPQSKWHEACTLSWPPFQTFR